MRIIIHDLEDLNCSEDDIVLSTNINNCIGCFNCWVKTPLNCVINDFATKYGQYFLEADELLIISKCVYGMYSSTVKKVLERCISYVEPYFTIRNNEIHHKSRTNKKLNFKVIFYGNITNKEKEISRRLVISNSYNLNSEEPQILYFNNKEEIIYDNVY